MLHRARLLCCLRRSNAPPTLDGGSDDITLNDITTAITLYGAGLHYLHYLQIDDITLYDTTTAITLYVAGLNYLHYLHY